MHSMDITIQFGIHNIDMINRQICIANLYTYGMIYYYLLYIYEKHDHMFKPLNLHKYTYMGVHMWSFYGVYVYDDCN